jgi:hypothetical protein
MGWYHTFPVASPQRTDQICDMTAPKSAGIVLLQRASMDDHEPSLDFEELPIVCPKCGYQMRLFGIEWETDRRDLYTSLSDRCNRIELKATGLRLESRWRTLRSSRALLAAVNTCPLLALSGHSGRTAQCQLSRVNRLEGPINRLSDSIARCRQVISVAVSQIDCDPIVSDRLVDPPLEVTVAHIKKIVALQCAGRRYPMAHENAEDLMANVFVGKSVRHGSPGSIGIRTSYKPMRACCTVSPAPSRELSSFVFNRPQQSRSAS